MKRNFIFLIIALVAMGVCAPLWAESRLYLLDGQTRQGFIHVRHGRATVVGSDRLYQHPVEAIHRIEHVSGETTIVGSDDILLRETPERLSKTLVAIPKGCEVNVLEVEGDWVKVEVYGGRDRAEGYIHRDDLSDEVFFRATDPRIRFRPPPPSLAERFDTPQSDTPVPIERPTAPVSETAFEAFQPGNLLQGIRGLDSPNIREMLDLVGDDMEVESEEVQDATSDEVVE